MKFLAWFGNGLTLLGCTAAIATPLLSTSLSTNVAVCGGVVALLGSAISIYMSRLQGLELEGVRELAKPRQLDPTASKRLSQELSKFAGQRFELYVHNHDESRRFAADLSQSLINAGFEYLKPRGDVLTGDGTTNLVDMSQTGVVIGGPLVGDNAAVALAIPPLLKKLGFEAKTEQHLEFDRVNDRIHVYVGMKIRGLT